MAGQTDISKGSKEFLLRLTDVSRPLIVAEGYLMELQRRGYSKHGSFVPTVVLDHPEKVEELTRELVHAGSEVCQAFVYYAHEEKMKTLGKDNECLQLNNTAHEIAKKVARETGTLFSAGIGTTNIYDPTDGEAIKRCEALLRNQISISAAHGVDFIVCETFWDYGEASIALKICREFGIPTVVTLSPISSKGITFDGYKLADALKMLENEGAACVGLNCVCGPKTIIPFIKEARAHVKGPLACVSTGYRTSPSQHNWYHLRHPDTGERCFPDDLDVFYLGKTDVEWYAKELQDVGVEYVGFCCGNCPSYTRTLAMSYGRQPPAAKYTSDYMKNNSMVGDNSRSNDRNRLKLAQFMGMVDEQ